MSRLRLPMGLAAWTTVPTKFSSQPGHGPNIGPMGPQNAVETARSEILGPKYD